MSSKNVRVFELRLGKRALILFILGMSSLLFFVFYLGVMVGQDMDAYPEKYSGGLFQALLEKAGWTVKKTEVSRAAESPPSETAKKEGEKVDLTFFDTLEKRKGEAKRAGKTVSDLPPPATEERKTVTPEVEAMKESGTPSSRGNESSENRNLSGKGTYQVQVISYKEKGKAERLAKKLNGFGYTPHIEETNVRGKGKWFRVILDGFAGQQEALTAADNVSRQINGLNCVVRKKER